MILDENKYLGKLCPKKHDHENMGKSIRYIKNDHCCLCAKEWLQENKDKRAKHLKKYFDTHKEQIKKYRQKSGACKRYYEKHKEKCYMYSKLRHKKLREDNVFKIGENISLGIWRGIRGNKKNIHWENLVGYTLSDLKKHLEKQFSDGMTWDNYGKWHIDHIIPVSVFNYSSPDHIDFKRCWALSNLRPLWAKENISKGGKIETAFQPSLQI